MVMVVTTFFDLTKMAGMFQHVSAHQGTTTVVSDLKQSY